jgi:hypothetical protein
VESQSGGPGFPAIILLTNRQAPKYRVEALPATYYLPIYNTPSQTGDSEAGPYIIRIPCCKRFKGAPVVKGKTNSL